MQLSKLFVSFAVAFAGTAQSQDKERDTDGIYKYPGCSVTASIKSVLTRINQESTGLTAISDKWKMEIYANRQTGAWTLVGASNDKSVPEYKSCYLSDGPNEASLLSQGFMKTHFAKYLKLVDAGPKR